MIPQTKCDYMSACVAFFHPIMICWFSSFSPPCSISSISSLLYQLLKQIMQRTMGVYHSSSGNIFSYCFRSSVSHFSLVLPICSLLSVGEEAGRVLCTLFLTYHIWFSLISELKEDTHTRPNILLGKISVPPPKSVEKCQFTSAKNLYSQCSSVLWSY